MDVFQGPPSNSVPLLDIMGKSKEISQDLHKKIVDLHKSGSSLREISKRLKVPPSSQLHQLCKEEWAKIHPTYCGKLVEGYPKCFTQVKQFKDNATKY